MKNIVRVNKTKNYTVMSNTHLRDINLSWKAKGIHSYVLSLPDDWKIILSHLETMATDKEKSLRSGLKELYDLMYWQKYPVYENGKIIQWITEIYEEPFTKEEKVKSIIIRDGKKTTSYEHTDNTDIELLPQKVEVGYVEVGNVEVEKEGLLNTNTTKDLFGTNNSFNQSPKLSTEEKESERVNEFKQIINNINLEDFREYSSAVERAVRDLYYRDKPLSTNGTRVPPSQIREDLKRLEWKHIDLAIRTFEIQSRDQEIKNEIAYLSVLIYNSIFDSNIKLNSELRYNDLI